jgi:beta-galactosidase/beta-glucuronidase
VVSHDFDAPQLKDGRRALINFGAVDYYSEVYVNGKRIGAHEGGYTPFEFDVTDALKPGANQLVVRVIDPPMDEKEGRRAFPKCSTTRYRTASKIGMCKPAASGKT